MGTSLIRQIADAVDAGVAVASATVVDTRRSVPRRAGARMLVYGDGRTVGTIGGGEMEQRVRTAALAALTDGRPRKMTYQLLDPTNGDPGVCGGEVEIYVEPHLPEPTIYVIGCGHVGAAVVELAHWLGFRVVATDDRTELVTAELMPLADIRAPGFIGDVIVQTPITANTDVVIVTRNMAVDLDIIPAVLGTEARSIGVMGSKRRFETTVAALRSRGVSDDALARLRSPIGLEIAAETPQEIAVSILAEIVLSRRAT